MEAMPEKILLVDDEPNVLRACERLLHNRFETDAAVGGAAAKPGARRGMFKD